MATPLILLFFLSVLLWNPSFSLSDGLQAGSSLSVEAPADVLTSPDGSFSAGFHPVGKNAYAFAIWFNKPTCSAKSCTIVWMANRDQPVNGKSSKLSLLRSGNLVLKDAGHIIVWETKTVSATAVGLKLENGGNLVLRDFEGLILWQSYDSPTDTLLPLQPFNENSNLVSSRSQGNYSSGYYKLYFDSDNVLCLVYKGPEFSSVFWPSPWLLRWEAGRSTFNNSKIAVLDSLGNFTSTDNFTFLSADYGSNISRMLKLDSDGNLRSYSLKEDGEAWVVSWLAFPQPCMVHGCCGPNSICIYSPSFGRKCRCSPGYKLKKPNDWSLGCEPEFPLSCNQTDQLDFLKLRHVEFYGYDFNMYPNVTLEDCKQICLQLCDCRGFQFRFIKAHESDGTYCYPKTQLLNGHRPPNFNADFYVKLPKAIVSSYIDTVEYPELQCSNHVEQLERKYTKRQQNKSSRFVLWTACYLLATTGFRKYTYGELKKATNTFSEEIGRGAGGIVYKATLSDGRVAAIKRLLDANKGEAEFLAEVNTIGKLNHMNLIEMWGYCAEGKHRLLVYEYMEHGSLAENISSKYLDWDKRFDIALGTARGLAYLHEECLEWVLHCDIKPQNILIDSNYRPKVSDFGLSWLLNRGDVKYSKVSRIRGTRGYMAPEWVFNLPITSKVDVYSYGILLLELVTAKSPAMGIEVSDDGSSKVHRTLVEWVRGEVARTLESGTWKHVIVDPKLEGIYDEAEMVTMVNVALRCVHEDRDQRPTMGEVVRILLRDGSHRSAEE
ncbi:putative Eukaryotic aspartyl protease family protein [Hibiscus syriacus]|uniref:Receptor-like serine/threonine-protein kinase n=1 Tax=Hibiscus syriacus TaxID=106335 RepID=A0A6A2YVU5_HIBSY|nr:putative Eukaryotic aspartyl protease family protein [Hibiscus syriacus]